MNYTDDKLKYLRTLGLILIFHKQILFHKNVKGINRCEKNKVGDNLK